MSTALLPPVRDASTASSFWQDESLLYQTPHPRLRQVANLLNAGTARRLLDVGCGPATLRSLLAPSFTYFGCDITDHAAPLLGDRFLHLDFNVDCGLGFFANRRIDVVHIGGVLEYLRYPGHLLGEIRRITGQGARLIATSTHFESHYYRDAKHHHPQWIYKPALAEFLELLASAGWLVRRVHPLADRLRGWRRPLWRLNRWLRPASPGVWLNSRQVIVEAEADRTASPLVRGSGGGIAESVPSPTATGRAATGRYARV